MHRVGTPGRTASRRTGATCRAYAGAVRRTQAGGAVLPALWLVLLLALATLAAPARANGTPIRIVLSYLEGVSNFGPRNATGVAELITSEGEVRLTATGLQQLGESEEYRLWIIANATNERLSLATFSVADNGVARLDLVLKDPIPEKPWDLMLVSVEAKGAQPAAPSARHAIAGRFPTVPGGGAQPSQLPNTGGDTPTGASSSAAQLGFGLSAGVLALLALLAAGLIGFALGRAGARRGAGR